MRKMSDYDEEYVTSWWQRQTPLGLFAKFIGLVVVLAIVFGVLGFVFDWFGKAGEVISPENVSNQYTQLEEDYQSLKKMAGDVCGLRTARDQATDPDERSQRTSQVLASEQNYRRIAADYDRRWANAFEAKYVGPGHLPTTAPKLEAMTAEVCTETPSPTTPTG